MLRVVYNASNKQYGPSLNECLYTGQKFGHNIMDITLRFCVHKIVLTANIEKAFHMVSVDERKITILWVDGVTKDDLEIMALSFKQAHSCHYTALFEEAFLQVSFSQAISLIPRLPSIGSKDRKRSGSPSYKTVLTRSAL